MVIKISPNECICYLLFIQYLQFLLLLIDEFTHPRLTEMAVLQFRC